ncbi:MAG: amidohydrolase [Pelagibacterium sp. SCN 63-23]|nr:MAG: amidohydrolase [Pelagibacterium sp. SCN 63-23]
MTDTHNAAPQPVDILVSGCDIVTLDDAGTIIRNGAIAVSNGRIVWMGKADDAAALFTPETRLDGSDRIAMPGLIDGHMHTAQQLLRGKIFEMQRKRALKIPIWKNYYIPFEGMLTHEDVELSGLVAYTNMISVGTTCFAEAGGPHPDAMGQAALDVGIRGFIALSTVDQTSNVGASVPQSMMMNTQQAYDRNIELVKRWADQDQDRVRAWLGLRQIIVCSPELINSMSAAARELDVKIHTHLCEGAYEIDYALEHFGKRPTEYLADLGVLDHHLHCAHSVLLSPDEVDLYVKHRPSACHCGFNNYSIGAPRLIEMWRKGIDIGMGTDGAAAWGSLDIFQVAHVTRIGQQALGGTPWHMRTAISSEELLAIATRGGARSLGLAEELGSLEVGKRADLLLVDSSQMDQQPILDPLFAVSSTVVGRDVRSVVVDGKLVMKEREFLTVDIDLIKARLAARGPELMARFEALVA